MSVAARTRTHVLVVVVAALAVLAVLPAGAAAAVPSAQAEKPFAVPRPECGPGSLPETGLQGEVPLADQATGRSMQGYRCNLELVGRYAGNGGAIMMAWQDHCAYMATGYAETDPDFEDVKGVVVIDASDPRNPVETTRLQTEAMINPWESLKANPRSGLLAAGEGGSFPLVGRGASGPGFDVYDVSRDCAQPELKASLDLPDTKGHEGNWAPDGRTYYQSTLQGAPDASVVPIDLSDPANPRQLTPWSSPLGPVHAVSFSEDGNRGYFMVAGLNAGAGDANGLVIVDTSEVQARKPDAQIREISHVLWQDAGEAQLGTLIKIGGHPYVMTTDEFGAAVTPGLACQRGQNPYGFVHLVDVADETRPTVANVIRMEVNDPANCATTVTEQNAPFALMYSAHYCTPDDPQDTTHIACAWISSGVRVFDVRDPLDPKEVAYYNPPANLDPETIRGGAPYFDALVGLRTKDSVSTQIRWVRDEATGEQHLWFISGLNGFQVVRFTNGAYGSTAAPAAPAAGPPPAGAPATGAPPAAAPARARGSLPATGGLPVGAAALAALGAAAGLLVHRRRRHGA